MNNDHAEIIVEHLLEGDENDARGLRQTIEPSADQWGEFGNKLGDIEGKARESTHKFGKLKQAIHNQMPRFGDKGEAIKNQLGKLEGKYKQRDVLLAKIRYAAAYRRACAKAGVNPGDVVKRFTSHSSHQRMQLYAPNSITELELKDGRRVKIEPVEIPLALTH